MLTSLTSKRHLVAAFSVRLPVLAGQSATKLFSSQGEESASSSSAQAETQDVPLSLYRNKNNREDQVFSAMSKDGGIKVTACTVRNLVNDLMIQHTMTKTPSDILGRTIACSLLMANGIQDEQVVQITLNCTYSVN